MWKSVTAINTVKTEKMATNTEMASVISLNVHDEIDEIVQSEKVSSNQSSIMLSVEKNENGDTLVEYSEESSNSVAVDQEYEYCSDDNDNSNHNEDVENHVVGEDGQEEDEAEDDEIEVEDKEEDSGYEVEDETVRQADFSYYDQLIPSSSSASSGLENLFSDPNDPEYLTLLTRLQEADDDIMVRDCLLDSYFQFKEQQKREEKLQSILQQYQHSQALASIQQQIEKEKVLKLQEEDKQQRFNMIKGLDCWITRNLRLFPVNSPEDMMLSDSKDQQKNLEKEGFLRLKQELSCFVESKRLLSYDSYCFCFSHVSHIGEKHNSLLDEITNFPIEEDNDYQYE
jgi:hypothetical protein